MQQQQQMRMLQAQAGQSSSEASRRKRQAERDTALHGLIKALYQELNSLVVSASSPTGENHDDETIKPTSSRMEMLNQDPMMHQEARLLILMRRLLWFDGLLSRFLGNFKNYTSWAENEVPEVVRFKKQFIAYLEMKMARHHDKNADNIESENALIVADSVQGKNGTSASSNPERLDVLQKVDELFLMRHGHDLNKENGKDATETETQTPDYYSAEDQKRLSSILKPHTINLLLLTDAIRIAWLVQHNSCFAGAAAAAAAQVVSDQHDKSISTASPPSFPLGLQHFFTLAGIFEEAKGQMASRNCTKTPTYDFAYEIGQLGYRLVFGGSAAAREEPEVPYHSKSNLLLGHQRPGVLFPRLQQARPSDLRISGKNYCAGEDEQHDQTASHVEDEEIFAKPFWDEDRKNPHSLLAQTNEYWIKDLENYGHKLIKKELEQYEKEMEDKQNNSSTKTAAISNARNFDKDALVFTRQTMQEVEGAEVEEKQAEQLPGHYAEVGGSHRTGGQQDGDVLKPGGKWREIVLFDCETKKNFLKKNHDYIRNRPLFKTRRYLRNLIPEFVEMAENGYGEIILSELSAGSHILPHCAPNNLRLTCHLGIRVPKDQGENENNNKAGPLCRIRVGPYWKCWKESKCLLFDDSFEHEVENFTNEARVVLLIRFWHPLVYTKNLQLQHRYARTMLELQQTLKQLMVVMGKRERQKDKDLKMTMAEKKEIAKFQLKVQACLKSNIDLDFLEKQTRGDADAGHDKDGNSTTSKFLAISAVDEEVWTFIEKIDLEKRKRRDFFKPVVSSHAGGAGKVEGSLSCRDAKPIDFIADFMQQDDYLFNRLEYEKQAPPHFESVARMTEQNSHAIPPFELLQAANTMDRMLFHASFDVEQDEEQEQVALDKNISDDVLAAINGRCCPFCGAEGEEFMLQPVCCKANTKTLTLQGTKDSNSSSSVDTWNLFTMCCQKVFSCRDFAEISKKMGGGGAAKLRGIK
ncbi:unnamed protein product [Amoebophrya sp. A120]|nr:unnamed protein product [Amoebophrya sp. A120]|eukprot:GSA120T00009930001.1